MNRGEFDDKRRTGGSVKAAIKLYGDKIQEGSPSLKKLQAEIPEV